MLSLNEKFKQLNIPVSKELTALEIVYLEGFGVYSPERGTCLLVEALAKIVKQEMWVLDIGTGSGTLAVVAAKLGAKVVATDVLFKSLKLALRIAQINEVFICAIQANLLDPFAAKEYFDLIVANLPTLPTDKRDVSPAIGAGPDGRKYLDRLIPVVSSFLKPGGIFLIQHSNFANIEQTIKALKDHNLLVSVEYSVAPLGEHSAQEIDYFRKNLPSNCQVFAMPNKSLLQKIAVIQALKP